MAKPKKRIVTRKKASKRGKTSAKPARKKAVKRATPKKRPPKTVAKMAPRKAPRKALRKAPRKAPRQGVPVIEDTIIDVIDEPVPGVVRVREYEMIRTTTPKGGVGPETEE
jgi:hypothetical protein